MECASRDRLLAAHGDAAGLELAPELVELDVRQLVVAGERLQLALLDLTALLDLLEEAVGVGGQVQGASVLSSFCGQRRARALRLSKRSTRVPVVAARSTPV